MVITSEGVGTEDSLASSHRENSQLLTHSPPQILLKGKHVLSVNPFLVLTSSNSLSDQLGLENYKEKVLSSCCGIGTGNIKQDASLNPIPVLICTLVKLASHVCEQASCHPIVWVPGWAAM